MIKDLVVIWHDRSMNSCLVLNLNRQGPAQSMPWLADLVETNEGSWSLLPVQCLCEFLLHEAAEDPLGRHVADLLDDSKQQSGKRKERRHKQQQLVQHLQLLLKDANQTADACREVLDYLCRRLSSKHAIARLQALAVSHSIYQIGTIQTHSTYFCQMANSFEIFVRMMMFDLLSSMNDRR